MADRGGSRRPAEAFARGGAGIARSQGVQHAQHVLHPARARRASSCRGWSRASPLRARRRGQEFKLHVVERDAAAVPGELFARDIVRAPRARATCSEKQAELMLEDELGREWEWEETPEVSLVLVDSTDEADRALQPLQPALHRLPAERGRGRARALPTPASTRPSSATRYTRWVDGQFALHRPELGLSSWQAGRLFARGGVLTGDGVYTVRTRYVSLPE